jgi:cobalt-zinc-cadmium efflux system outer membrane protein
MPARSNRPFLTLEQLMSVRILAAALACLVPASASAEPFTLEQALALARQRAPQVLAAETSLAAERGARRGATPLFAENPSVEGGAGMIFQPSSMAIQPSTVRDARVGPAAWLQVTVPVEIALQRWRRVAAADARINARRVERDEARREALFAAGVRFYQAIYAGELAVLAQDSVTLANRLLGAGQRQFAAGAVSALDVKIAELELSTAKRSVRTAEGSRLQAQADLATLLGVPAEDVRDLRGSLTWSNAALPALELARERALERPDVRLMVAERQAALQEANVASAGAFPTPRFKGYYQYWNTEHSAVALVEVPLPIFQRGQGEEARARARASGLAGEADARRRAAVAEVESAHQLATSLQQLRLEQEGSSASMLDQLPADLEKHYVERRIELGTLLTVRRQVLQARKDAIDAQFQEALARLWLDAAMGVLQ